MKPIKVVLLASALVAVSISAADAKRPNRWFMHADTNHDGKLSKQEFLAAHEAYFNEADANHDGFLTQEEMKALADKKRAERHKKGKPPAPKK